MKNAATTTKSVHAVALRVAPEDVCVGMEIAVLTETFECPTFLWCGEMPSHSASEPVRLTMLPKDAGLPLRVKAVCLPFVLTVDPDGSGHLLDTRRMQLVRLDREYAKLVRKAVRTKKPAPFLD
jgi:hypothetical protein